MTEQMRAKIKLAAEKLDKVIDFKKLADKISNKWVRFLVGAFEVADYQVFKVMLTEVVDIIPESAHPVVEAWLEAFIAGDYILLVDTTGGFLAELDLVPLVEKEDEKRVYAAILTALVKIIPCLPEPQE